MRAAKPPTDSRKKLELKTLDRLQRTAPLLAIKTWWAVAHWYDSCSVVELRSGELVDLFLKSALQGELEEFGLPEEVRDYVFVQSPSKARAQELAEAQLAKLDKHSMPPPRWCFEAIANLAIESEEDWLALAGLRLRSAGDVMITVDGPYHEGKRVARKRIETLQGDVAIVQALAEQLARAGDVAEVELTTDEAERLRSLARLHVVWPGRIEQKVSLVELEFTPRVKVGGSTLRYGIADPPLRQEGHWLSGHDIPMDPYFDQNWIIVRAMNYLVSYCLGLEKRARITQCRQPHGVVAQRAYNEGRRSNPPSICGTYLVTTHEAGNCGKSTCETYQRELGPAGDR